MLDCQAQYAYQESQNCNALNTSLSDQVFLALKTRCCVVIVDGNELLPEALLLIWPWRLKTSVVMNNLLHSASLGALYLAGRLVQIRLCAQAYKLEVFVQHTAV